jgi:hypothetical protein
MSDYVDQVLAASERVIGSPQAPTQFVSLEEPTELVVDARPAAREDVPEAAPIAQPAIDTATLPKVSSPPAESADVPDSEPLLNSNIENPIGAARIETLLSATEPAAIPAPTPVPARIGRVQNRNAAPSLPSRPALSWATAWVDVPEPRQRNPNKLLEAMATRPAIERPAEPVPAPVTADKPAHREQPLTALTPPLSVSSAEQAVTHHWAPDPPSPPKPAQPTSQGLVIQNLEIRIVAPDPGPPAPVPAPDVARPAIPAGAWVSPARRYAGRL